MNIRTGWLAALAVHSFVASAGADVVIYEFTGILPAGASSHSQVSDGESWTVLVEIDDTVADSDPTTSRGSYPGSVLTSSITFSGGYSQTVTGSQNQMLVFNDRQVSSDMFIDGLQVGRQGDNFALLVQTVVEESTAPVTLLPDDSLVGAGVAFSQAPSTATYNQLGFVDADFGGEFIFYDSLDASNTTFESYSPTSDSDGDGVPDDADNCTLRDNADQRDTNSDGFGNICDPDLNNDGIVNAIDLGLFKAVFFSADADADFEGNGVVNAIDLGIIKTFFFMPPGPSGVAP